MLHVKHSSFLAEIVRIPENITQKKPVRNFIYPDMPFHYSINYIKPAAIYCLFKCLLSAGTAVTAYRNARSPLSRNPSPASNRLHFYCIIITSFFQAPALTSPHLYIRLYSRSFPCIPGKNIHTHAGCPPHFYRLTSKIKTGIITSSGQTIKLRGGIP